MEAEGLSNFYYLVFQSYPTKEKVYYWIDGDRAKKVTSRERFLRAVDKVPSLKQDLFEAISTTSYFMYDNIDCKIFKLEPKTIFSTYQYPLGKVFQKVNPSKKVYEYDQREKPTLADSLNSLGFEPPSDEDTKNLRVALTKQDKK